LRGPRGRRAPGTGRRARRRAPGRRRRLRGMRGGHASAFRCSAFSSRPTPATGTSPIWWRPAAAAAVRPEVSGRADRLRAVLAAPA